MYYCPMNDTNEAEFNEVTEFKIDYEQRLHHKVKLYIAIYYNISMFAMKIHRFSGT